MEAREASLAERDTLQMTFTPPADVERLTGFNDLDEDGLRRFIDERGLAMDYGDIAFCQEYFKGEERLRPMAEIE